MSEPAFVYLHVRTPYGPGGGPGLPAAYLRRARALGYTALGCADIGAWPGWAHTGAVAGVPPIFGLELSVGAVGEAETVPVLLLARDATGLQHLIGLHNAAQAGPVPAALLLAHAAGLTAICLAYDGAGAGSPLVTGVVRRAELDPWRAAFGAGALYFGLPAAQAEQALLAERAVALGLPLLALPTVCYPDAADAAAHAALCAWRGQPVPDGVGRALLPPDQVEELYAGYPAALAAAGAVAAGCGATLRELHPPDDAAAGAALTARVRDALAGEGRAMSAAIEAELAGLHRLGLCRALLMAATCAAAARARGVTLGAPGGVAATGQVAGLLGLHPPDPFGAWPPWLAESVRPGAVLPQVTVAACRRGTVLTEATRQAAALGGHLVAAGGWHHLTPAEAVRLVRVPFGLDPVVIEELVAGLANTLPGEALARTLTRPTVQAAVGANPALGDALQVAAALAGTPVAPLPDQEMLVWVDAATPLPLISAGPPDGSAPYAAWPATTLGAWGWPVGVLRGDPTLDTVQRAAEAAPADLAGPPDGPALLLAGGQVAGVPLAQPAAPAEGEPAQGVAVALANALLPPAGDDPPPLERAILGVLVGGARVHPWAPDVLRRRLGQVPAAPPHPVLAPVLAATGGVPLFQEQFSACAVRLALATELPGDVRFRLQSWLDETAVWAMSYAEAEAAGRLLIQALRLKAGAPAAFLAAALTHAAESGDSAARAALLAEAPLLGVTLLPPDVDRSAAAFTVEREPGAAPAVRWGLLGVPGWTGPAATALVVARAAAPDGQFADLDALCAALDPRLVSRLALDSLLRTGAGDRWGTRDGLLGALDGALARARIVRQAALAGTAQLDLFAAPDVAPDAAPGAAELPADAPPAPLRPAPSPEVWRRWEEDLLGQAFTPPPDLNGPAGARGGPVFDLRHIGPAQRGTSVTLPVVLAAVRVVAAPEGGQMALARAEDAGGMLPLVVFPDVYGRSAALCTPGSAVIVTARVQQAEAGAGGGSAVVLVATRLAPYKTAERGPGLDVTPVERRAPAARAPRKAPDPTEYSKTGARYYRAPRPDALPEPPPDFPEPPIEAYEESVESAEFGMQHGESGGRPPASAEVGLRSAELSPPAAPGPPRPSVLAPVTPAPPTTPLQNPKSKIQNPQVRITLPPLADETADAARLRELRAILRRFPGDLPVTLVFPADVPDAPAEELPLKYGVALTPDLRAALAALLDPACLAVE